jgi:hypothetical protein
MDNAQKIKLIVDDTNEMRDRKATKKKERIQTDVERDNADELVDVPFGKAVSFKSVLRERLLTCFDKEEHFFGRSTSQRWQRLNTLFVKHSSNIEMMKTSAFNMWMNGKTKNPRITADQRSMLEMILSDSEKRTSAAADASMAMLHEEGKFNGSSGDGTDQR